jgi:hypothetical protein
MKSQKAKYILLIMVVLVWSMIIARFFSLSGNDSEVVYVGENLKLMNPKEETPMIYNLRLNYRDPFLDDKADLQTRKHEVNSGNSERTSRSTLSKDTVGVKVPKISYIGMLGNLSSGEKIGFFVYGRKEFMSKVGDSIGEIRINALSNDSVRITYMDHVLSIKKDKLDK